MHWAEMVLFDCALHESIVRFNDVIASIQLMCFHAPQSELHRACWYQIWYTSFRCEICHHLDTGFCLAWIKSCVIDLISKSICAVGFVGCVWEQAGRSEGVWSSFPHETIEVFAIWSRLCCHQPVSRVCACCRKLGYCAWREVCDRRISPGWLYFAVGLCPDRLYPDKLKLVTKEENRRTADMKLWRFFDDDVIWIWFFFVLGIEEDGLSATSDGYTGTSFAMSNRYPDKAELHVKAL